MLIHPDRWGPLRERFENHGPRRILALDGGGIRGLLTLGILERIEKLIRDRLGLKICEYFDYVA